MSYDPPLSIAQRKIKRLDERILGLHQKRTAAVLERGAELGFEPCGDCLDGFCTMNCSTAPGIMKVSFP